MQLLFKSNLPTTAYIRYTVPKAAHISEKYLGVYMGASPLAGKFPFRNFRKHLTLLPSEISEKSRGKTKIILAGINLLTF